VFTFTLREVPAMIKSVIKNTGRSIDTVDAHVMHQAFRFVLQHLTKEVRIPSAKVIVSLENFGNTSSASIPLTMTVELADNLSNRFFKLDIFRVRRPLFLGGCISHRWSYDDSRFNSCGLISR